MPTKDESAKLALTTILTHARNGIDWDNVINYIIQVNPELVAEAIVETAETPWFTQVKSYAAQNPRNKVGAIKLMRGLTGHGLKESKDWVEENCPEFRT